MPIDTLEEGSGGELVFPCVQSLTPTAKCLPTTRKGDGSGVWEEGGRRGEGSWLGGWGEEWEK